MGRWCAVRAGIVLLLCMPQLETFAGDDVDYSAPYITVEDGKLVTRYPTIQHPGGSPAGTDSESAVTESTLSAAEIAEKPAVARGGLWWLLAGTVLVLLVLIATVFRRRPRTNR